VPIAPTAGVLQWVDKTAPLTEYLIGHSGGLALLGNAHERYRPLDWSNKKCRHVMEEAHRHVRDGRKHKAHTLDEYHRCEEHFRPVFHHFFVERWAQPAAWFDRRLAYASSLAAGSMIGYVLGLGDRHMSNILIDLRSAELVHIDLGIAFEAGKLLTTPETVPFRLTRDLEDGLGVCGVEGVMRGGAEQTMRVLRANTDALVTILQVFVRNPLYKWTQDPTRDRKVPKGQQQPAPPSSKGGGAGDDTTNQDAERTLLRIQQKLEGHVAGGDTLSVEGQVRRLLDEARDPEHLAYMYEGWAPWL